LRELLTNYDEICEVFFDGAEPGQRRQNFDWGRYYKMIRELQPNAVIAIRGPDVRWVGNESGVAGRSEWNVIRIPSTDFLRGD
jgi:alpha-L-fucosidase